MLKLKFKHVYQASLTGRSRYTFMLAKEQGGSVVIIERGTQLANLQTLFRLDLHHVNFCERR